MVVPRLVGVVVGAGALSAFLIAERRRPSAHAQAKSGSWDSNWDMREAPRPKKDGEESAKPTASRHLILIRHGQYEHWHSDSDKKVLTEIGRKQAMETGKRLKALGGDYSLIIFSTLPRARETAAIISSVLPDLPTKSCDLLREGAPIRPEPLSPHWKPPEHEFFQDSVRIEAAFRKYFHRASPNQKSDSTEIIVCHANVIRYFACRALQLSPEAWLRMSLGNGSTTRFTIRPNGRVSLKELGNTGHLPPELVTYT